MSTTQTDSNPTVPPEIRLARNVIAGLAASAAMLVDGRMLDIARGEKISGDLRAELAYEVGLAAAADFSLRDWTAVLEENHTPELTGQLDPHQQWARDRYPNNDVLARITACLLQTYTITPAKLVQVVLQAAKVDALEMSPYDQTALRKAIRRLVPACATPALGYYTGAWNAMLAANPAAVKLPKEELHWEQRLMRPNHEFAAVAAFVEYETHGWRFAT